MKKILVLLVVLGLLPLVSQAEVYRWVDERGVTHYTDDPSTVPEDYLNDAERLEMPGGGSVTPPVEVLNEDEEEENENEGILVEDDLKEKDEEWWRGRSEKWKERLQAAYDDYEKVRLKYNSMATEFNASTEPETRDELKAELEKMQAEMESLKADIEKARKMTEEVLPSQAQKAGKPLEWVR
jgi:hypothetical protein